MSVLLWELDIPGYMPDDSAVYAKLPAIARELPFIWRFVAKKWLWGNYIMKPAIRPFVLNDGKPRSAMLVIPGGSYAVRADKTEGTPVAEWLNSIGISAFVLDYRAAPYEYPVPLLDAKRAMRYIRANAERFGVDKERVGVMGFSAGGHLASMLGTKFDEGDKTASDPVERQSCRPDLMALCYPVITMGEYTHRLSRLDLIGANPAQEQVSLTSSEKQVTKGTPPTFIWHTKADEAVPVENTLMFADALKRAGVPCEPHIFPTGKHGLGLAKKRKDEAREWPTMFERWLKRQWGV